MGELRVNRRIVRRHPVRTVRVANVEASRNAVAGWASLAMDARHGSAGTSEPATSDAPDGGDSTQRGFIARPRTSRWDRIVARLNTNAEPCEAVRAADEHLRQAINRYRAIRPNGAAGFERALDEIMKGRP